MNEKQTCPSIRSSCEREEENSFKGGEGKAQVFFRDCEKEPMVTAKGQKFANLLGMRFGKLIVVSFYGGGMKNRGPRWNCKCDCGKEALATSSQLRAGQRNSCGCLIREKLEARCLKHGFAKRGRKGRTYRIWVMMSARCYLPTCTGYKYYGGKGITVCERWSSSFENFLADMGECPEGMSIDRIDGAKGYSPENCRWATYTQQNRNRTSNRKITAFGKTQLIVEWSEEFDIPYSTLQRRLKMGVNPEKAMNDLIALKA